MIGLHERNSSITYYKNYYYLYIALTVNCRAFLILQQTIKRIVFSVECYDHIVKSYVVKETNFISIYIYCTIILVKIQYSQINLRTFV